MTDENEVIADELPEEQEQEAEQQEEKPEEAPAEQEDGAEPQEEDASPVIKTLRKQHREQKKELRELRAKLDQYEKPKQEEKLPPRPKLEDDDVAFDEEAFAQKIEKWLILKQQHEQKIASVKEKQQKQEQSWQAKLQAYEEEKSSITADDYEDAEEEVIGTLSQIQQAMIMKAAKSPTKLIYAIGRDPEKLAELADIDDPVDFVRAIFELEAGTTTMTQKKIPPPVKRVASTGGQANNVQKRLQDLLDKAGKTGDMQPYLELKRKLKAENKI